MIFRHGLQMVPSIVQQDLLDGRWHNGFRLLGAPSGLSAALVPLCAPALSLFVLLEFEGNVLAVDDFLGL